uniref:Checkpoint protein n=1 Tax=Guillardia theta (strain CCMP2712) TaxID=905079 RepID=A0A0C3TN44_GUITC
MFRTYRIESKNGNNIAFELDLSSFERALRTAETSNLTTIKLAKRDDLAFLSFESTTMSVIQDVPIEVLSSNVLQEVQEPDVGKPVVQLLSPSLRSLLNVVERLKSVDGTICISGNMAGELEMEARTEFAFMSTTWKDLGCAQQGKELVSMLCLTILNGDQICRSSK